MKRICTPTSLVLVLLLYSGTVFCQKTYVPIITKPIFSGKTRALRDVRIVLPGPVGQTGEFTANPMPEINFDESLINEDKLKLTGTQDFHGSSEGIATMLNIEGIDNLKGGWPADPNGDIGLNHYVQTVNSSYAVYDKSGNILFGPVDYQSIFEAFPGPWNTFNWCDPVILYDHLADRWVFTTMSLDLDHDLFYEMNAVSVSPDPMGEYFCYAYQFENVNDYPKMSVWPNGYYITYNIFSSTWQYKHPLVSVVNRDAMLNGEPDVPMVQFVIESVPFSIRRSPMTADHNGSTLPSEDGCYVLLPEYSFAGFPWEMKINMFRVIPDWQVPANSIMDSIHQFQVEPTFPHNGAYTAPQPGNFHNLETIIFYLMYPLHYRNFGTFETMVTCQTLYNGELHYLRWYEFRKDTDDWYIYQTGNYLPDSLSRYVPSITINGNGDIAMGFTKSSLDKNPSIWLTGRKADDSLGVMSFQEIELYQGLNYANNYGSGNNRNRWGDYASMMVDPLNDSTFWFTSMYPLENTNPGNWSTRIFAFNLNKANNDPLAYAGPDTIICMDEIFVTNGMAENFSYLYWDTEGDGNFTSNHSMNVNYIRGNQDLENGEVKLSLKVEGHEPGSTACDTMILFINDLPDVEAGNDDTICCNQSISLNGQVLFSDHHYWTSTGDGSFNDSTMLDAIYTPAMCDTTHDHVILTLHADAIAPCTNGKTDELKLFVESCVGMEELREGPLYFTVYPNPTSGAVHLEADHPATESVFVQVLNVSGERIFTGSFETKNGSITKEFDLSHLASGIYYFRMIEDHKSHTIKLIKK